ncbi:MAG: hypothetical protein B7X90_17640 [Novosphingobium sp. 17-62-19]|uniref:methyl-accepting chemotaxis protein n=1 Tax=Novosphingobium sp. 17-62-19 TaxID=1970406 RepID=UPI000BC8442B|nr:methyl-accepting chemotaxis protein [Novosphingobium sp. 17-62-19]OZA16632.1 MAG: hypothetical protein B7X90_17640 [Novosphingobium sp. 17-62-19]HQS97119.1 methyl-accepting chemotaxis protein [Novosphingobium sp.]
MIKRIERIREFSCLVVVAKLLRIIRRTSGLQGLWRNEITRGHRNRITRVQVKDGVSLVDATGGALKTIVQSINRIAGSVQEIAETASSQSDALEHVRAAVSEMDRATQQNAAMVEESTAAARQLAEQSTELSRLVDAFNVTNKVVPIRDRKSAPAMVASSIPAPAFTGAPRKLPSIPRPSIALALKEEDWDEF